MRLILPIFITFQIISSLALAKSEHKLMRRVVVFPISVEQQYAASAENAWWRIREILTQNRRFLVASKRFLIQKDVYQPREELKPSDVILLTKLLDAHALVTGVLKQRKLILHVYSYEDGLLLWKNEYFLHPSIPVNDQLDIAGEKLIKDFVAAVPYNGFHIVDPLIGKPVYEEGDTKFARIDIGRGTSVKKGQKVQWISVKRTGSDPLYLAGSKIEIIAEGEVFKIESETATVEVQRIRPETELIKHSLVHIPFEANRLKSEWALKTGLQRKVAPQFVSSPLSPTSPKSAEVRPFLAALTAVANMAVLILLAF